jgi:hypothetical protein
MNLLNLLGLLNLLQKPIEPIGPIDSIDSRFTEAELSKISTTTLWGIAMSTGGIEISFLQLQAAIIGFSANRVNHTAQVWVEGDAVRFLGNGGSAKKRLVRLIQQFDDCCCSIVVFDSSNKFVAKLVCNADYSKWTLLPGTGFRKVEKRIEKRNAYVASCAGEAEDAPEMPCSASVSLPAGVGWSRSL